MSTTAQTLITLAGVQLVGAMSPGPNAVLVLQNSFHCRKLGIATAAGIYPAGVCLALLVLLGMGTIMASMPKIMMGMYLLCGLYLIWLGVKAFRRSFIEQNIFTHIKSKSTSVTQAIWAGTLTNITNPKTLAYLTGIFAAIHVTDLPMAQQIGAAFMMQTISFSWYCVLALVASSAVARRFLEHQRHWLDRIAGIVMFGFGVMLLVDLYNV